MSAHWAIDVASVLRIVVLVIPLVVAVGTLQRAPRAAMLVIAMCSGGIVVRIATIVDETVTTQVVGMGVTVLASLLALELLSHSDR